MDDFFRIGVIANTHALKGELKILPTTDDPSRFDGLESITVTRPGVEGSKVYHIDRVWHNNGMVILKLRGIDDIDTAAKLKGHEIIVSRADAIPLEEGEYYHADLLGLGVITEVGEDLGKLTDILDTGANDVYVVTKDGAKPLLIPAIKQCILSVDIPSGVMTVRLLEGLR
ncbi:MAG: ribosome maturation factor RimM [Defluviitaleaceae bacterium]|nr:ribosome maturation factor RimM [Defluviitaleaceae bacterium]